ncbi:MAG: DUF3379 family protein [Woeseiaceae bacterium]|nr:DUF3379 family protein [Woeseiaceae bacterium]
MDCKDYKEAIAADPSGSIAGGAEHIAGCESCRAFRDEMQALDASILGALNIDVPALNIPELPAISQDDNVVSMPVRQRPRFTTPAWIGIAASFALAAIIGLQLVGNRTSTDEQMLAAQVLAHLDHEPWALKVTDVAVSDERYNRVINPSVGTMDRDVGLVSYAQSCIINGHRIPHLVIQGQYGPVTLLLMPDETVHGAVPISGESVKGVILPHGDGSIAIIGEREERIEELGKRVTDAVEWTI